MNEQAFNPADCATQARGLCKSYPGFQLRDISFIVPKGRIVGFIGENGAGKTTTISLLLNLIKKEAGELRVLGMDYETSGQAIRRKTAALFEESTLTGGLYARDIGSVLSPIYPDWDEGLYGEMIRRFKLPPDKAISKLSRGMRAKASIAAALATRPDLLILDEATTGLDAGARDEMESLLLQFIEDGEKSVFFSTHLTEDLARIADYIILIHQGKIIFEEEKDTLLDNWGIVKLPKADADAFDLRDAVVYKEDRGIMEILVRDRHETAKKYPAFTLDTPTLDSILLFYIKGEQL